MIRTPRASFKDKVWLSVAFDISTLGTCARRQVGAVFLDANGHVLSTGYNGPAPEATHCIDLPCPGANCPSGTGLELCEAIHAEQNGIVQCRFPMEVDTVYCTDSPCIHCVKMLAATSVRRIVFARAYPHTASEEYCKRRGIVWDHVPIDHPTQPTQKPVKAFSWLQRAFAALTSWVSRS